jgi:hypothetical protein
MGVIFIKLFLGEAKLTGVCLRLSIILASKARTYPGRGKYHCTIDHLFDWYGLACFINKNKNFQLSYS